MPSAAPADHESRGILTGHIYTNQPCKSSYLPELFHTVVVEITYLSAICIELGPGLKIRSRS